MLAAVTAISATTAAADEPPLATPPHRRPAPTTSRGRDHLPPATATPSSLASEQPLLRPDAAAMSAPAPDADVEARVPQPAPDGLSLTPSPLDPVSSMPSRPPGDASMRPSRGHSATSPAPQRTSVTPTQASAVPDAAPKADSGPPLDLQTALAPAGVAILDALSKVLPPLVQFLKDIGPALAAAPHLPGSSASGPLDLLRAPLAGQSTTLSDPSSHLAFPPLSRPWATVASRLASLPPPQQSPAAAPVPTSTQPGRAHPSRPPPALPTSSASSPPRRRRPRTDPAEAARLLVAGETGEQPPLPTDIKFLHARGIARQPLHVVRRRLREMHITTSDVVDVSFLRNGLLQLIVKRRALRHIEHCLSEADIEVTCLAPSDPRQLTAQEWASRPESELPALASTLFADRASAIADRVKDARIRALLLERAQKSRDHAARLLASASPATSSSSPQVATPSPLAPTVPSPTGHQQDLGSPAAEASQTAAPLADGAPSPASHPPAGPPPAANPAPVAAAAPTLCLDGPVASHASSRRETLAHASRPPADPHPASKRLRHCSPPRTASHSLPTPMDTSDDAPQHSPASHSLPTPMDTSDDAPPSRSASPPSSIPMDTTDDAIAVSGARPAHCSQ